MKNLILTLLLAAVSFSVSAQEDGGSSVSFTSKENATRAIRVESSPASSEGIVENPDFFGRNNKVMKVTRVAASDKETVLYVTLTAPNSTTSVSISSSSRLRDMETGRTYRLRRSVGFTLDKFQALRNGSATLSLIFDPVPEDVKRLDFIEGTTSSSDFKILGLQIRPIPGMELYDLDKYKYYYDINTLVIPAQGVLNEGTPVVVPMEIINGINSERETPRADALKSLTIISVKYLE